MPGKPTLFAAAVVAAIYAAGAPAGAVEIDKSAEYRACMALVKTQPKEAFETALAFRSMGGGMAAEHCAAAALIELGLYTDAAQRLETLAQARLAEPKIKARLYHHAGQAWLLAGKPEMATQAISAAIGLLPGVADFHVDRAQAWAARKDYAAAEGDLSVALNLSPSRADVYALRASARRFLDRNDDAIADARMALELEPNNPEALLERGILRRLAGDDAGARADWMKILNGMPDSTAAEAARKNIELMDVKPEGDAAAPPRR